MAFKKGTSAWNKGKPAPWAKAYRTGKKMSVETKEKLRSLYLGKKLPQETKDKIRAALKGKKKTSEHAINAGLAQRGKKLSEEHKRLIGIQSVGRIAKEKNPAWKGGVTSINAAIRGSKEYILWRKSVFERDNYTCIWCLVRGGELHADHIKPFAYFPELRFAIDNGRTLCVSCHRTTDTYGNKAKRYER